jgi:hypothetical protein
VFHGTPGCEFSDDITDMRSIDISRLDLNLLVVFDAIYREKNVSWAARSLGKSQTNVSAALSRLRNVFQDPLFVRNGGRESDGSRRGAGAIDPNWRGFSRHSTVEGPGRRRLRHMSVNETDNQATPRLIGTAASRSSRSRLFHA